MAIPSRDRAILRQLAEEQAAIAALPVQQEKAELWRRLNDLEPVRPLVWITEVPWHEMNINDELTLQCEDPWAREVETNLRRLLYQWRHFPADMVVSAYYPCQMVIHSTGFGLSTQEDIVRTDEASDVVSHRYHSQFSSPEDIEKIQMPEVKYDAEATEREYQRLCEVFGDILPVEKVGKKFIWFAPWDELVTWWGVEEGLRALADQPEMAQAAISRLVDAHLCELEQWEQLGLLTRNDDNTRIGSGGYGYTQALPASDFDPQHVRPRDMWGSATAQIFGVVSPRMHWEFALQHELRWLERWGMTYYGCCEPLDRKIEILRHIPNLRKISISPWADIERAVKEIGRDYVLSRKPNPAVVAEHTWRPEIARTDLVQFLERARGCQVEIILKDISTVRYEPKRLWEWEKIAMDLVEQYG